MHTSFPLGPKEKKSLQGLNSRPGSLCQVWGPGEGPERKPSRLRINTNITEGALTDQGFMKTGVKKNRVKKKNQTWNGGAWISNKLKWSCGWEFALIKTLLCCVSQFLNIKGPIFLCWLAIYCDTETCCRKDIRLLRAGQIKKIKRGENWTAFDPKAITINALVSAPSLAACVKISAT